MSIRKISKNIKWLLILGLVLLWFMTFVSCSDDLIGPRIQGNDEEDNKDKDKGKNMSISQIFESPMTEHGIFVGKQFVQPV